MNVVADITPSLQADSEASGVVLLQSLAAPVLFITFFLTSLILWSQTTATVDFNCKKSPGAQPYI